jgi:hypothetical protein
MLLRTITSHVKEQNWFAVFIDFINVVLNLVPTLRVVMHRLGLMRNLYRVMKPRFVSFPGGIDLKVAFRGMHYHAGAWEREVAEDTP